MKRSVILTVFSLLVLAQLGLAQVPQTINHQGVLRDASGDIVDDGVYTLTFKLWNAAEGGTELWSEAQSVPVIDGIFSAVLGVSETFSSTLADFESPLWLEMWIEAGPGVTGPEFLSPRIELTAVPYAIKSRGVAGSTNVFPSNGNVGIGTTNPNLDLSIGTGGDNRFGLQQGDVSTNAGYLRFGDNTGWKFHIGRGSESAGGAINTDITGALVTFQDDGSVGIGTPNPSAELEVVGGIKADSILLPATERWYSIPAPEFDNNGSTKYMQPYHVYATGAGNWYAPVHLPHGATITGFEANIYDNDSVNVTIELRSVYQNNTSYSAITSWATSGESATVQTLSNYTLSQPVDNQNNTYMVYVYWTTPQTESNIKIHNSRIKYTVDQPLP